MEKIKNIKTKEEFIKYCNDNKLIIDTCNGGTHSYGTCCNKKYKIKSREISGIFKNLDYIAFIETYIEYDEKEYVVFNTLKYKSYYKNDLIDTIDTDRAYTCKAQFKNNVYTLGFNKNIDKIVKKRNLINDI